MNRIETFGLNQNWIKNLDIIALNNIEIHAVHFVDVHMKACSFVWKMHEFALVQRLTTQCLFESHNLNLIADNEIVSA